MYARFASVSHPLVGRDLLELRREHVFGRFEIEAMRIPFSLSGDRGGYCEWISPTLRGTRPTPGYSCK
jgi:hypothetical protein